MRLPPVPHPRVRSSTPRHAESTPDTSTMRRPAKHRPATTTTNTVSNTRRAAGHGCRPAPAPCRTPPRGAAPTTAPSIERQPQQEQHHDCHPDEARRRDRVQAGERQSTLGDRSCCPEPSAPRRPRPGRRAPGPRPTRASPPCESSRGSSQRTRPGSSDEDHRRDLHRARTPRRRCSRAPGQETEHQERRADPRTAAGCATADPAGAPRTAATAKQRRSTSGSTGNQAIRTELRRFQLDAQSASASA